MLVLAFDTTCGLFSIAIAEIDPESLTYNIVSAYESDIPNSQSQFLIPKIQGLFHGSGISLKNIKGLLVTRGPGSFTGVRLGLSAAYGLKAALPELKLYAASTMQVLAYKVSAATNASYFNVALKAGVNDFYMQSFQKGENCSDISVVKRDEIAALQSGGAQVFGFEIPIAPTAMDVVAFFSSLKREQWQHYTNLEPLYVRDSYF